MTGYRVVPERLDEAAEAAAELAKQGASIDVAAAAGQAPAALPGSRAEGKLRDLARAMHERTTELADDTRDYGSNLATAAEYYRAHDQRVAADLDGLAVELGAEVDGPR